MKKNLKKIVKIFLRIIAAIFVLLFLLILVIQIPSVQHFIKDKTVNYIEGKIKTKVSIDSLKIGFPEKVILKGVYFEDQKKDTLLAGEKLAIDISLFQLLNNKVEINSLEIEGISSNLKRDAKGIFNFDYIIKAFTAKEKPKKEDSTPLQFSLGEINLNRIKVNYKDALSKDYFYINLKHFNTAIETFDLDKMNFEVPKITINGLELKLKQGLAKTTNKTIPDKGSSKIPLKLQLGEIDFRKLAVDYSDENSKLNTTIALKNLLVKFDKIDLNKQFMLIKSIDLSDTKGVLALGETNKSSAKQEKKSNEPNNWEIKINKTSFKQIDFRYDDNNAIVLKKGFDYNHLNLKNLNLEVENINYNPENISGNVNSFKAAEQSGLIVQSFTTDFFYGKKNAYLKKLYLRTPQTLLKDEILIGYPSIASLTKNLGELRITATLKKSKLGFKDVLLFVPKLSETNPFKSNPTAILLINSKVSGKLKNIEIPNLEISGIGSTQIAASGKIIGLPDLKKANFDLTIKDFKSSSKDVNAFVSKGTIPNSIQLPLQFSVKGTFKGTIDNFYTNINLLTSSGNAKIKTSFDQRRKKLEKYDAQAEFDNFDLGRLLKNDSIGKITLKATIKGAGLNPKTANAIGSATIIKADYNKYVYQNININGVINNGNFDVAADAKDPNLTFGLISSGSFRDKYPSAKVKLNVDIADLNKLNLHAGPMKLKGIIDADFQTIDLDYLNGNIKANTLFISTEKHEVTLDSITLVATSTVDKNTLLLQSSFLNAEVNGKYKLSQIANAFSNSLTRYYDTNPKSKKIGTETQQFDLKMEIKHHPIFLVFLSELKSFDPITVAGKYNSENDYIMLNGSTSKLIYGENTINGAVLNIDTQDNSLVYSLLVDDIQGSAIQSPYTNIFGKVKNNILDYSLQLKDLNDKNRYFLSGTLKALDGNSEITIDPKTLLLDYDTYNLSEGNAIRFGKKGLNISDFEIGSDGNTIKIQSQSEDPDAPIAVDFKNFEVGTVSKMVLKSDLQMSGKVNGNALLKTATTNPVFISDLTIEDFRFKKDTLGTIAIKVNNQTANTYDTKIAITGHGNQVNLDGIYNSNDRNLDMKLLIEKLNMKSIQGFSMDQITESTGFLTGNFQIIGNSNKPMVIGELQFNDVGFKIKQLNAKFKSVNDKITFTNDLILFDRFVIKDESDNELVINGKIDSQNYSNLGFDLAIDAENFKAVNSKAKDNDLFYGELFLDNHLTLKGTFENPTVEGNIKINKDTKLTVVVPQSAPSIADREGIVEFIDQDHPEFNETVSIDTINSTSDVKGFNAYVNIEVDKEADLTLIIDKANGDFLKLKGAANLNGGIDPSGKTTLTGKYEFSEGSYEMTFNSIKKKFDIKKGSYVIWTGDPTSANISVTAIYKIKTAPIDLMYDQLGNISDQAKNTYKEKIPFETELKVSGELMKPDISFNIVMPENTTVSAEVSNTIKSKLDQLRQNPDELNKQVFALLLFGRFMGEDPFASETGDVTAASMARESASKILTQQMNNFAGDLISGVELNFDLTATEDYSSGQLENRTDLNVEVSKKMFSDRLKVTVGSNFGLQGSEEANQGSSNIGTDVFLDYQLTKDGKYKIRGYRVNKYQVALQGEVIETGIAFIVTLDYEEFKELFRKSEAEKLKEKREKELKKKSDE